MNELLHLSKSELSELKIVDWAYTEEPTPKTLNHYDKWIDNNYHGPLNYLADERKEKRKSLKELYPDFQSALVFLFDYTPEKKRLNQTQSQFKMASYVSGFEGHDYHYWIKEKLEHLSKKLKFDNVFYSIDAQPVLERDLAYRAGLGWFGKNSMLISKAHGSYFLIGSILIDKKLSLNIKTIETDHCGTCTKCIDECPTHAIVDNKVIDSSRCISTFTIEQFKPTPAPDGFETAQELIFGCDICQEVCPWNNKPLTRSKTSNSDGKEWMKFFDDELLNIITKLEGMSNREYKRVFKLTPLERTGRIGMLKNLKAKL